MRRLSILSILSITRYGLINQIWTHSHPTCHSFSTTSTTTRSKYHHRTVFQRNMSNSNPTTTVTKKSLVVDPFCYRQFNEKSESLNYGGNVFDITIEEFEKIVNERFHESLLVDGYAPFCKHVFLANDFIQRQENVKVNVLKITNDNVHLLRTKYEARNELELPVLVRYFPKELLETTQLELPTAKYLDLILYSREQIIQENKAQGKVSDDTVINTELPPWGIVSIKAQDSDHELPMNPITSMRNALGKEEGGSGVPMNRVEYMKAVKYWDEHAVIS